MTHTRLTRHAAVRANQRGVTRQTVEAVIAWAGVELPARDGCSVLRFSRERLADRDLRATLGPLADRVCSLALSSPATPAGSSPSSTTTAARTAGTTAVRPEGEDRLCSS
jgi:hypothetical protein